LNIFPKLTSSGFLCTLGLDSIIAAWQAASCDVHPIKMALAHKQITEFDIPPVGRPFVAGCH
jgi:hypothetical protein